ncbi:MAG TPA: restriction endonuclease subunit S [Brumimicrobium sp.]|nr:restriction endonuclease subunit S [Brumimicrobium sp.]
MKKYKKYEQYKDCDLIWLNEIPEHWETLSFRNILVERNEKNSPIKSKERLSLSINKGVTLYADKTTNLDRFKDDFTKYKLAHEGDLVLNSMNMIVGAVGVSKYYGCVSPVYYTFSSDPNNPNSTKYYEYLFRSKIVQGVLFGLGRGLIAKDRGDGKYNTLRLKVSRNDLRSLKLPKPSPSEQIKIAAFLDYKLTKINRFIQKKKQLIKLLNEQKAVIINQAVTKGLDPNAQMKDSGIDWLGNIPEHWHLKKVKEVFKFDVGFTPDTTKPSYYFPEDYTWVNISDLTSKYISNSAQGISEEYISITKKEIVPIGSLLYSFKLSVGKVAITTKELYTNEAIFAIHPSNDISIDYFFYSLPEQIHKNANENIYGAKILNQKLIKNAQIVVPPFLEQEKIVNFLNHETGKIEKTISTIEKEIALTQEYKTALIAEAVTGKIDVRDFEIPKSTEEESYEDLEEKLSIAAEDEAEYQTEEIEE